VGQCKPSLVIGRNHSNISARGYQKCDERFAFCSLSHLPEAERKAWKELFDYFVFQSNEEALSHLPNEQRGVHAKMDAQLQQHMLSYLMRQKLM
jgi:hypothetical protein